MMVTSCGDICGMFGGTCLGAQLNDVEPCVSVGDVTCDDITSNDSICICDRA